MIAGRYAQKHMKYILLLPGLLAGTWVNAQNPDWFCDPERDGIAKRWYDSEIGNQKVLIIYPQETTNRNLVVFIHGDSPFGDPVYQYNISKSISEITNAITVAILRPGYRDGCGDLSGGIRGLTMGDNYTEEVVKAIASVISTIREEESTTQTIVMGHSGGAALTALLAGSNPGLVDQSILVACPCNLEAWRKSMEKLTNNPNWLNPMGGLSPMDNISKLDLNKKIHLYVGEHDLSTPPFLTTEFYNATNRLGADVTMKIVPGEDHESILKPTLLVMMMKDVNLLQN